jgi:hypothetical protein
LLYQTPADRAHAKLGTIVTLDIKRWRGAGLVEEVRSLVAERLDGRTAEQVAAVLEWSVLPVRKLLVDGDASEADDALLKKLSVVCRCEPTYLAELARREGLPAAPELPMLSAWEIKEQQRAEHKKMLERNRASGRGRPRGDEHGGHHRTEAEAGP